MLNFPSLGGCGEGGGQELEVIRELHNTNILAYKIEGPGHQLLSFPGLITCDNSCFCFGIS